MAGRWILDGLVDLATFELLAQVSRTGSLSGSAHAMGISQQAVSARLNRAERLLGRRLVQRGVGGSALTETGSMVLEWASPVLEAARRAATSLDALRQQDAPLTVASSQTIAEVLLPGWLQSLRRRDAEQSLRLLSGNSVDVVALVRSGTAQLGFIESPEPPHDLRRALIVEDALVVVVGPDHPWAQRRSVDAGLLAATPLLLRETGSGTRATFEAWLESQHLELWPPAAELGTTSAIRAAAGAGVAPAVLSGRAVVNDIETGALLKVLIDGAAPTRTFSAIWSSPELMGSARSLVEIALQAAVQAS